MKDAIQLFRPHSRGRFLFRKNRFVIRVIHEEGFETDVHAPNPGKLLELYLPGTEVLLEKHSNPARKLPWSLAALRHGEAWVPMVSAAANSAAAELAVPALFPHASGLRREVKSGDHRLDLAFENGTDSWMAEVKSCSLVEAGAAMFPDAPSIRACEHLELLMELQKSEGIRGLLLFVINHGSPEYVIPNYHNDPRFALTLIRAREEGVSIRSVITRSEDDGRTLLTGDPPAEPGLLLQGVKELVREDAGLILDVEYLPEEKRWQAGVSIHPGELSRALNKAPKRATGRTTGPGSATGRGAGRVRIPMRSRASEILQTAQRLHELLDRWAGHASGHASGHAFGDAENRQFAFPGNPLHIPQLNRSIFQLRHRISLEQLQGR
ncbi:DNA/RNA nuclease SfsA [Salinispira pacifica]|uniref:Sugar fermentation stimulation protein homolog n=1 Tax=Salinispira pacifica TaxID=1307761 RepID=V5WG49_9SPIO|nr:DNA/RNA nuclease SfsA [Salinispira pacifica]AHC14514.1 hypothetical protein L21SP2_1109 [Salinispira pacifica]